MPEQQSFSLESVSIISTEPVKAKLESISGDLKTGSTIKFSISGRPGITFAAVLAEVKEGQTLEVGKVYYVNTVDLKAVLAKTKLK